MTSLPARALPVLGFLIKKGLLVASRPIPFAGGRITIEDALWTGEQVEPRVLEVLPAALVHFPRSFEAGAIPDDLANVIKALQGGDVDGPTFRGMDYDRMKRWANRQLRDGRTRPLSETRRNKTFRLSPAAIAALEQRARRAGCSQTRFLEELLLQTMEAQE